MTGSWFRLSFLLIVAFILMAPVRSVDAQGKTYDFYLCVSGPEQPLLLGGARPASQILSDVELLSQPLYADYGDTEPLVLTTLPADLWVIVFDIDEQARSWFRVFVPCDGFSLSGWIPADTQVINQSIRRTNIYAAPPGCARALDIVTSLDTPWSSTVSGRVAVAFDIYRDNPGERIQAFFYPLRDGRELREKERRIETSGAYLLTGSVVSIDVQQNDQIELSVIGASSANMNVFGIIFEVPEGCQFAER